MKTQNLVLLLFALSGPYSQIGLAEGPDPVGELGRCYEYNSAGEPNLRLIVYGNTRSAEVLGVRETGSHALAASGNYTYNAAQRNHLIAFRPNSRSPLFELSNPVTLSWVSSRLDFEKYSEAGETLSQGSLVCFDLDLEAPRMPAKPVIVEGFGLAEWNEGEEHGISDVELAISRADADAAARCRSEIGTGSNAHLLQAHTIKRSWGGTNARAKYECRFE